jgi:GntR family transcriptional repressor for pyruvate dehydrogenase complex
MFEPVKNQRISDEILQQIREAVFSGKFQIGDRLPNERNLAELFAASRTSVREALRALEQEGVIYIKKGASGGVFVSEVDHRLVSRPFQTLLQLKKITMENISEVRLIFEPEAARLAALRAEPKDLRALEDVIGKMTQVVEEGEPPSSNDLMFHKLIARAAKNPILEMLSESMLEVASQVITDLHPSMDVLKHVLRCHKNVFDAIRSRNGERARAVMSEHILDVQKRLSGRTANGRRRRKASRSKKR